MDTVINHLLVSANYVPSPNYNQRPKDQNISLLVIHNISLPPGQFGQGYIQKFFQNQLPTEKHPYFKHIAELQVSSHLLIERDGAVTQFVPFNLRAWHAGESTWQNNENCNDFSIGIELEGTDDKPYTSQQYDRLIVVTIALLKAYPCISLESIVGHAHIAPERKTDPGPAFNWHFYKQQLLNAMIIHKASK